MFHVMFKLVDFLSSQKAKKNAKASKKAKEAPSSPRGIVFTTSDKEEIKRTVRGLNRETSMILTKQIQELNQSQKDEELEQLARELAELESSESEDFGTFRPKLAQTAPASYDLGTFRPQTSCDDDNDQYGTFRPQHGQGAEEDDDSNAYGTFRRQNTADLNSGTFNVKATEKESKLPRSVTDPSGDLSKDQVAPDLANFFREPESWEKHILALEKGEWTEGMEQNGAFKRWKKERPSMPSIYLREASESS
uniref:Uncharacterized protein n=1 Tax=Vannella robusta TaxID=1487602 RepID=A0A7S4M6M5_9EUKA